LIPNFRQNAREAYLRAKEEFDSLNPNRIKYAALELRMAMEALTYDRMQAYKEEIPPDVYQKWQPRKVMEYILDIDPYADKGSIINMGKEEEPGKPAKEMEAIGSENVLNLKTLKKHYNALGAYLHIPTFEQINKNPNPNQEKLRTRCEEILTAVKMALASTVWNCTFGNFSVINCIRCGAPIRRRIPDGIQKIEVKCFECEARYTLSQNGSSQPQWEPIQQEIKCPSESCNTSLWIWKDEIKSGGNLRCNVCENIYHIGLGLFLASN
jgi:hypothetical protein